MMIGIDTFLTKITVSAFFYPKTLLAICLLALASNFTLAYLYIKQRKKRIKKEEKAFLLEETLESFPDGFYLWTYNTVGFIQSTFCSRRLAVMMNLTQGKQASFDSLLETFAPSSAEAISNALHRMRTKLEPFMLEVFDKTSTRSFYVSGFRTQTTANKSDVDILWVQETTQHTKTIQSFQLENHQMKQENELFTQAFNTLPFPIWFRNEDLQLSHCNQAYIDAVQADSEQQVVLVGNELVYEKSPREAKVLAATARATGKQKKAKEFVVINGKRRWIESSEIPLTKLKSAKNSTIGFVRDISVEKELEDSLNRQISSQNGVLEHLKTAIAVFDSDMQLQFYNTAFMNLWDLEEEWLDSSPTYSHFLDTLREKRKLPENRDFEGYKKSEQKYFTSLVSANVDVLHLPTGVALRRMLTPYPLGGLLITYEDLTGQLTMQRSVTVLNEIQHTVLDHLKEGILLFGRNGRLKLANKAYKKLWQLNEEALSSDELSIAQTLEAQKDFFEQNGSWETLKEQLLSVISAHTGEAFQILRPDEKIIEFTAIGLPDGGIFVSFFDVTEEENITHIAKEKQSLFATLKYKTEQAESMRALFVEQLNNEIRPQLSSLETKTKSLLDAKSQRLTNTHKKEIESALQTIVNLKELFLDFGDLALIEIGSSVLDLETINLYDLIKGLIKDIKETTLQKKVFIDLFSDTDIPDTVIDKKRLKQALFYILQKAILSAKTDSVINLSLKKEDKYILINIEYIMSDPKDEQVNTLIKNLVELHAGEILCTTKNDKNIFSIHLPLH